MTRLTDLKGNKNSKKNNRKKNLLFFLQRLHDLGKKIKSKKGP